MTQSNVEHSHSVQHDACCGLCRWFKKDVPLFEYKGEGWRETGFVGLCRRNAPDPQWPRVTDKDVCGQYVWQYA